jgi:hypothetical protein
LSEIAQPWHIHSSLIGPNPYQLVREAIQRRVNPVAGCRRIEMKRDAAELTSPLFTEKETAFYLRRSLSSIRRGRKDGSGPEFIRIGRSVLYQKSQLDAYSWIVGKPSLTALGKVCPSTDKNHARSAILSAMA